MSLILYAIFLIYNLIMTVFSKNIVIRSGLGVPIPWSVGLKFFTEIDNVGEEDCSVEVYPDECCLDNNDSKCDIIELVGSANDVISGGATKTLTIVAPLLDPYERKGYCTLYVDSRPISRPKNIVRDTIKIKFDTKLNNGEVPDNVDICKHIDEDPMNDCKPVNCDTYYNGKRSHFSVVKKRCVAVPVCLSTKTKTPKSAYNPVSNKCINNPAVSQEDIDFIRKLTQNEKPRMAKDVMIIKLAANASVTDRLPDDIQFEPLSRIAGVTSYFKNLKKNNDKSKKFNAKTKAKPKEDPKPKTKVEIKAKSKTDNLTAVKTLPKKPVKYNRLNSLMTYLSCNRYTLVFLTAVVLLQCVLICTMVYCMTKKCGCCKKKEVVKKFFNYRHDASVTTPLIGTSNNDTETTECHYMSESSNYIDKKIKCYKACQKERKNNVKLSMSDDILSKCITRRDWQRLPRSETIPEANIDDENKDRRDVNTNQRKAVETKVNFREDKKPRAIKSIVKKDIKRNKETLSDSSEREIQCHNYNYDNNSNFSGFKKSSTTFGIVIQEKRPKTHSIEQGAQAYFSNDSIDDFLSERGVIFIGDNASKYSYTSISSAVKSSVSSQSSKTSKNNIVKNVMSLLSRKAKGPSSDPGVKKSKADLDLELLHISKASVYSSSNDTDGGKEFKRIKDSTSSL